jgi:hypothetical protein
MNIKIAQDFAGGSRPKLCLGEMSVPKIWFWRWLVFRSGIPNGFSHVSLMFSKIPSGQSVGCSVDKLFTIGIKTIPFILPKIQFPVPKTTIMPTIITQTPTPYTRMCFPSDLARTSDFTQGQVGIPAATVGDRRAAGNPAKDGQPLSGASPPLGGNEAPAWGQNQHHSTTGKGDSLPAGRAF